MWFALRNWTGKGGSKEATKDPVDVLRYVVTDDPQFMDSNLHNTGPYGGRAKSNTPRKTSDYFRK